MITRWKFSKAIVDGERYEINGVNIWEQSWHSTRRYIQVNDPVYGQLHSITVWEISAEEKIIRFAAGEFSNCVWRVSGGKLSGSDNQSPIKKMKMPAGQLPAG